MSFYLIVAVILICFILEALYSGGEVALFSSDINKIRLRANKGQAAAQRAVELKHKPESFISTALVGTNLAIIVASTLTTGLLIGHFGVARGEQFAFVVLFSALFIMIIVRSIFQHYADFMAVRVAHFIHFSYYVFYPLARFIAVISRGAVNISSKWYSTQVTGYITKEGLRYILDEKTKDGELLAGKREMVNRVFDFSALTAGKIMLPITDLTALPQSMLLEEAALVAAQKKYMRIPVYADSVYNIVGILHYFDLLGLLLEKRHVTGRDEETATVADCMRKDVFYVPETKRAGSLLMEMRARRERMAVVVDEYGSASGIITMEDIAEKIVGNIDEEYNKGESLYRKAAPGRYLASGRMKIDELNESLPVKLPQGHYETLGGFLSQLAGRVPLRRERLEFGGLIFVVENADQKRVREVQIIIPDELASMQTSIHQGGKG